MAQSAEHPLPRQRLEAVSPRGSLAFNEQAVHACGLSALSIIIGPISDDEGVGGGHSGQARRLDKGARRGLESAKIFCAKAQQPLVGYSYCRGMDLR